MAFSQGLLTNSFPLTCSPTPLPHLFKPLFYILNNIIPAWSVSEKNLLRSPSMSVVLLLSPSNCISFYLMHFQIILVDAQILVECFFYHYASFYLIYIDFIISYVMLLWLLSHFSPVWLWAALWTVAHQAPLSMEFSRQEYWSGLPGPAPGDPPNPGIEPWSPALQADSLPLSPQESPS